MDLVTGGINVHLRYDHAVPELYWKSGRAISVFPGKESKSQGNRSLGTDSSCGCCSDQCGGLCYSPIKNEEKKMDAKRGYVPEDERKDSM